MHLMLVPFTEQYYGNFEIPLTNIPPNSKLAVADDLNIDFRDSEVNSTILLFHIFNSNIRIARELTSETTDSTSTITDYILIANLEFNVISKLAIKHSTLENLLI